MEKPIEKQLKELSENMELEYKRWVLLKDEGGSDPFWEDGVNMNLVRNHIIYYKRQIEDLIKRDQDSISFFHNQYPEVYYRETPPEVENTYMAKELEIKHGAALYAARLESNPDRIYLRSVLRELFPNGKDTNGAREAGISCGHIAYLTRQPCNFLNGCNSAQLRNFIYKPIEEVEKELSQEAAKCRSYLLSANKDNTPARSYEDEEDVDDLFEEIPEPYDKIAKRETKTLKEKIAGLKAKTAHGQDTLYADKQLME